MLKSSSFILTYTHNRNCFCYINENILLKGSNEICLKVSWATGSAIFWVNYSNCNESTIAVNGHYAKALNLLESTSVDVSVIQLPPVHHKVTFKACSEDDWLILEANSEKLQNSLLDQVRLVVPNQKLVLWVSTSLSFCVTSQSYGVLEKYSQIEVEPFTEAAEQEIKISSKEKMKQRNASEPSESPSIMDGNLSHSHFATTKPTFHLRVVVTDLDFGCVYHPYMLFVRDTVITNFQLNMDYPFFNLLRMDNSSSKSTTDNEPSSQIIEYNSNNIIVEFKEISNPLLEKYLKFDWQVVFITETLNKFLQLETGQKLFFENVNISSNAEILEIIPIRFKDETIHHELSEIPEKFKTHILECERSENGFIINNGIIVELKSISSYPIQFNLVPNSLKSVLVTSETIRNCKIKVNSIDNVSEDFKIRKEKGVDLDDISRIVKPFESVITDCVEAINCSVMARNCKLSEELENRCHFLITGSPGSGKSTICDIVAAECGLWYLKINCRTLKGKKEVCDIFSKSLKVCEEHSPSILICDNIDSLLPAEAEGTSNQDIAYFEKLTTLMKNMFLNTEFVIVVMTALDNNSVHANIMQSKADCLFTRHFQIPELEEVDRSEILQSLIKNRLHGVINVKKLHLNVFTAETVGYKMKDIVEYTDRKIFKLIKGLDLNADLDTLISAINNDKSVDESSIQADVWSKIGGLKAVKQSLIESICWPLMYPALFPPQCGGILLYGPPGTGKTLIGSCVARLNNISFVSVKGPELLSKYIGQSEMAVRNIFQKARKKSPCILFFDEFDSLAPSRGHDSTGVTDRVVNQLLTQMDGVEGAIRGVTIMAATSRPDLIDAALLRPGRFGKTLHCPVPDQEDRLEILKALSSSVQFTENVNLHALAKSTSGFSGADLKAVLVTAQLMALEKQISEDSRASTVLPLSEHFISLALSETKPSLSDDKLLFYETIYSRFSGNSRTSSQKVTSLLASRPRATLA